MEKHTDEELLDIYCNKYYLDLIVQINKDDILLLKNDVRNTLGFESFKCSYYFKYFIYLFLKHIRIIK